MKKLKIIAASLFFITGMAQANPNCENLSYDQSNPQSVVIAGIVCHVIQDSYSDLQGAGIKIKVIEESKTLSSFSKGRLSFISFFDGARFLPFSNRGFVFGYSRKKIFESTDRPSGDAIRAVVAHEMAHTVKWRSLNSLGTIGYAAYTTLGNEKVRGKYERSIDIVALRRGIESGKHYAAGLGEYREWNAQKTEVNEREYLKTVYYFKEQLIEIETLALSLNSATREVFFNKLEKSAPVSIEGIRKVFKGVML